MVNYDSTTSRLHFSKFALLSWLPTICVHVHGMVLTTEAFATVARDALSFLAVSLAVSSIRQLETTTSV